MRALLAERGLERALYAGDDTTDLDAFRGLDGLELGGASRGRLRGGAAGAARGRRPRRRLARRAARAAANALGERQQRHACGDQHRAGEPAAARRARAGGPPPARWRSPRSSRGRPRPPARSRGAGRAAPGGRPTHRPAPISDRRPAGRGPQSPAADRQRIDDRGPDHDQQQVRPGGGVLDAVAVDDRVAGDDRRDRRSDREPAEIAARRRGRAARPPRRPGRRRTPSVAGRAPPTATTRSSASTGARPRATG